MCIILLFLLICSLSAQINIGTYENVFPQEKPMSELFLHSKKLISHPSNLTELKLCLLKSYIEDNSAYPIYYLARYFLYGFPKTVKLISNQYSFFCHDYILKEKKHKKMLKKIILSDPLNDFNQNITKAFIYFLDAHRLGHKEGPSMIYYLLQQNLIYKNLLSPLIIPSYSSIFLRYLLITGINRGSHLAKLLYVSGGRFCLFQKKNDKLKYMEFERLINENVEPNIHDYLFPFGSDCPLCSELLNVGMMLGSESLIELQKRGGEGHNFPEFSSVETEKDLDNELEDISIDKKLENDEVYLIKNSAESGNVNAQIALGESYFFGNPGLRIRQNYNEALNYFEMAANQGSSKAMHNMGLMNTHGYGIEKNLSKAKELFEEAANLGSSEANGGLGYLYMNGLGVQKNINKSIEYYEKAVMEGNSEAESNLGAIYIELSKENQNKEYEEKAGYYFNLAAKKKHLSGMYNLAILYNRGININVTCEELVDYMIEIGLRIDNFKLRDQAFNFYKSGKIFSSWLITGLGSLFGSFYHLNNMIFLQNNKELSVSCTGDDKKLCELVYVYQNYVLNNNDLAIKIGNIFYEGSEKIKNSHKLALKSYQILKNNPEGLYLLGFMHEFGLGTEQNIELSKEFINKIIRGVYEGKFQMEHIWPAILCKIKLEFKTSWIGYYINKLIQI